jgi:drug/metabolite transporter (DMT)-like permease
MSAPQLDMLFLAIAVLGGTASLAFLWAWLAERAGREWSTTAGTIVGLSASWYCISMSLTLFNRMMLGYTPFSFPITTTISHLSIKGALGIGLALAAHARAMPPPSASAAPAGHCGARLWAVARSLVRSQKLSRRVFSRVLVPLGTATALDIWLSAVSLQTLDVSVYTTAKSCALIFTLGFSLVARLQVLSPGLIGTCLLIGLGVILAAVKPVGVDPTGLVAVLLAAACGAARWVFTEQYYKRPGVSSNALLLVAVLSPITVMTLVPGLAWELPRLVAHSPVHTANDVGIVLAMTIGGGVLAFLLLIVELSLVGMTSALTLNVIGHLKDVVVIGLAIPVLHEELSPLNAAGVGITIVATLLYSVQKSRAHAAATAAASASATARALEETWADPEPGDIAAAEEAAALAAARKQQQQQRQAQLGAGGGAGATPARAWHGSPGDDGDDGGSGGAPSAARTGDGLLHSSKRRRKGRRKGLLPRSGPKYEGVPTTAATGPSSGGGAGDDDDDVGVGGSSGDDEDGGGDGEHASLARHGSGLGGRGADLGPLVAPAAEPAASPGGAAGAAFAIVEEDDDEDATGGVGRADQRRAAAAARPASDSAGSADDDDGAGVGVAGGDLELTLAGAASPAPPPPPPPAAGVDPSDGGGNGGRPPPGT